ncbi:DUF2155 domain-containing protein [Erythrobacter alti]|uniref:DUF2155 domain-containing protein n=1 Tax=Erythrobacter alti TaxID=1896145 RepID=UPI0030F38F69
MSALRAAVAALAALALAACSGDAPDPEPEATEIPQELQGESAPPAVVIEGIGTPMEERIATVGLVNKRNNETRDIEMRPGESRRLGNVIVRLSACERSAPWEEIQQAGAFVQVFVNERRSADSDAQWYSVFSGWLFKESPSLNVVEHPIYDVWVKDCTMSFPGEEEAES